VKHSPWYLLFEIDTEESIYLKRISSTLYYIIIYFDTTMMMNHIHTLLLFFVIIWVPAPLLSFTPPADLQKNNRDTTTSSRRIIKRIHRDSAITAVRSSSQLEQASTFERRRSRQRRQDDGDNEDDSSSPNIVLVAGFESFNKELYVNAARALGNTNIKVFADNEIRISPTETNPVFTEALMNADVFIASLIFDYDDVMAVEKLLPHITGPKLLFECATELMAYNEVGTFNMKPNPSGEKAGPPPAVKAILSQFSSGKEEDRVAGYVKLLKFGPDLLQFVPGEKASDLKIWLEAYRYWNQGGATNVQYMFDLLQKSYENQDISKLPTVIITPDIGLLHPLRDNFYFTTPKEFLQWRYSDDCLERATLKGYTLAPKDAPVVAILLYRKHVITDQRYIMDLITLMEKNGVCPIPIFINGVEGHTIVRDLLTSAHEIAGVKNGSITRADSYKIDQAVSVDVIVNTIGFPLVGGPAGSMETGRNVAVAEKLLTEMNVPYIVSCPLLLQSIDQWKKNGVLGLQSVVLYSLPELDGAIDTVVLGGLVGDDIALVNERVRKLVTRIKGWVKLRRTPKKDRKIAIMVYGFPPNV
jgi:magnesium chelatase subunit H